MHSNAFPPPYPGYSPPVGQCSPGGGIVGNPHFRPMQMHASPMGTPPHVMSHMTPPTVPIYSEIEEKQRLRFQVELEFVQCLGNPSYLHFLAQRGYFKDPCFVNYLRYLLYWKEPKYVKYLKFPVCLHFLELLQHESFRKEIVNGQCAKFLDDQVILSWQHYTRKRVKLIETASNANQQAVQGTPSSSVVGQGSQKAT